MIIIIFTFPYLTGSLRLKSPERDSLHTSLSAYGPPAASFTNSPPSSWTISGHIISQQVPNTERLMEFGISESFYPLWPWSAFTLTGASPGEMWHSDVRIPDRANCHPYYPASTDRESQIFPHLPGFHVPLFWLNDYYKFANSVSAS